MTADSNRNISLNSPRKLRPQDAQRFARASPKLFVELAEVVCSTGAIAQKELHECWQMAVIVHQKFSHCLQVTDIAAGHGLLAWILVLLARFSKQETPRTAVAIDVRRPKSASRLATAIISRWPTLQDAVVYVEGSVDALNCSNGSKMLFVGAHACGSLSDFILQQAVASQCSVAIMPCCHSWKKQIASLAALINQAGLSAELLLHAQNEAAQIGQPESINKIRINCLKASGYEVSKAWIQEEISPFNNIIMASPSQTIVAKNSEIKGVICVQRTRQRGETRACQTLAAFDVCDTQAMKNLSTRPSREWLRYFDLSYWVDHDVATQDLNLAIIRLVKRFLPSATPHASLRDEYYEAQTGKRAVTYRIEVRSDVMEITKAEVLELRKKLMRALRLIAEKYRIKIAPRSKK